MFTARAATNSTVVAEIADSASITIFTRRVSGIASVGLKAIEVVNEMYTQPASRGRQARSASAGISSCGTGSRAAADVAPAGASGHRGRTPRTAGRT